ncbi:MAG: P-loop NTPase [Planctomycetales bacterium]|nr:P-loop NTPase [Planctomycetales bacterium]
MIDQATELRKLVLRAMRAQPITTGPPPRLIAVTGGKRDVGVTTIAVNLSVAMAEQGARVVIVDADAHRSDVAALCGISAKTRGSTPIDVHRDIHEVLHPGPAGIQIVPGLRVPGLHVSGAPDRRLLEEGVAEISYERFQRQLSTLGRHAEVVVLDLGSASGDLIRRFTVSADEVLLVTTTDDASVMDAYTRIKTDLALASERSLRLVVNCTTDDSQASNVHARIDASCRKFLETSIQLAGQIPHDDSVKRGETHSTPFVLAEPMTPASQAIAVLASLLAPQLRQVRTA